MSALPAFRDAEGLRYHGGAIGYALLACGLGVAGLFAESWPVNAVATLLLAHGMTIAAYMVHECAHHTVFRQGAHNARLGGLLGWICAAAYGSYEDIRTKHFRHHVDVDDVVWFDYERFFREHPLALRLTRALEWCYVPAHELIMHAILVFGSFVIPERRSQRARNLAVIGIRGGIFFTVLWLFPKVAVLYILAQLIMITILRFMDSLQHDYGYHTTLFSDQPSQHRGDTAFEQEHTFSNPLSFRHERINWLTLNFGFHSAHHARPTTPWWKLPALHRKLFGDDPARVIPLRPQLVVFHRERVRRIGRGSAESQAEPEAWGEGFLRAARAGAVVGGNAASFLTPF